MKLTQLGLDLDREFCFANLATLIERLARTFRPLRKKLYGSTWSRAPTWMLRLNSTLSRA